ncbi:MAG: YDG domain-containing protein [Schwartzia succinivorans]|nr:YDG domain-containing protein [Schwartzia succinivorans]
MNRKMKQEKLAKQISLALMAGMVTYTPVAFGMPVVDQIKTSQTTISDPTVEAGITVIDINGTGNNVINWKDFSIDHGEKVRFDNGGNVNNYANIVTGSATSFINGAMEGGNNVYLINPNGVIFGKGAEVNVGNLYVSTQGKVSDESLDAFKNGTSDVIQTIGTPACDVVNLGTIKADAVEVVGNNIRFLNAAQIQTKDGSAALTGENVKVTANADGYIHVGHEGSATTSGYTVNGGTLTEYQLVHNLTELQAMNGSNNYMLADDINKDGSVASFTPISDFRGNFDGMFYTINNLNIGASSNNAGLFGTVSGSSVRIENVGLNNVAVSGGSSDYSGGFVGTITEGNLTLQNVYNSNGSVTGKLSNTGGLVGKFNGTKLTISSSFNSSDVTKGAGLLGSANTNKSNASILIQDSYNTGNATFGIYYGNSGSSTQFNIYNTYTTSPKLASAETAHFSSEKPSYNKAQLDAKTKQASEYSKWSISDTGGVTIDADGNVSKPTWRIYAGQSLPIMLTAFFKGTVQADYNFTMGDPDTTGFAGYNLADAPHTDQAYETNRYWTDDQGNVVTTYNGKIVAATPTTGTSFSSLIGTGDNDIKYNAKTSANADRGTDASSSYALYSSGQLGYDVAGSNFTVEKRKVVGTSSTSEVTIPASKVYDGTSTVDIDGDVSTAFNDPTGITGIVEGDNVTLSGHVTGTMYESKAAYEAATDKSTVEVVDVNTEGKYYARLSFDSLALSGANKDNYELTVTSGSNVETEDASITPKELYVSLNQATGLNKTYDGSTDIKNTAYGWANVLTDESGKITTERIHKGESTARADDVSIVKGTDADNPVTYSNKNAGEQEVSYTGLALVGKEKNNYVLKYKEGSTVVGPVSNGTIKATGTITPKEINMASAVNAVTKEYDGNSNYTGAITLKDTQPTDGIISGDSIAFTIVGNGTFKEADGTTTTVHAGGDHAAAKVSYTVQVSGSDASNYKINDTTLADGTQVAGVVSDGTITKKALNVSYDTTKPVLERVYNGVSAVVGGTITEDDVRSRIIATGWVTGDEQTVVNTADYVNSTGTADSHVAVDTNGNVTTKNVRYLLNNLDDYTYSGTGLGTANVSNTEYTTFTAANAGKITQKEVTVNFADISKTYDGTTDLTADNITYVKNNTTLDGVLTADVGNVTLNTNNLQGVYKSKNVADYAGTGGTTDAVTYTNVSVVDSTGNHDYIVPTGDMHGNGEVTKRSITADSSVFGVDWDSTAITKTYDGNAKVKGATGYESDVYGPTHDAVTSTNFIDKLYAAGVSGESIAFKVATAVYDNGKNVTTNTPVTYTLTIAKDVFDTSNYDTSGISGDTITITKVTQGSITPKVITASISNTHTTKTYDGDEKVKNGAAEVTGADLVSLDLAEGDTNNSTAAYYYVNGGVNTTTKNASSNTVAGAQGILYNIAIDDGNGGNNYTISNATNNQLTGDGVINKAGLSLAFAAPTKDYDTTTAVNTVSVTPTGLKGTDTFNSGSVTGTYGTGTSANWQADANAGDKLVKYTGIDTALGDNYGNYNVTYGTETVVNGVAYGAGTINKLNLTGSMITSNIDAVTKTYDGTTNVNHFDGSTTKTASDYFGLTVKINGTDYIWKNSADKTYFKTVTGAYQDSTPGANDAKNAGTGKSVTYTVELADDLAANINLDSAALSDKLTSTGNTITKRQVGTVTAAPATGTSIDKVYDGSDSVDASTVSLTYDHNANINTSTTGILADDYAAGVTVSTTGSKYTSSDANWDPTQASTHDGSNKVQISLALNDTSGNYELASTPAVIDGNIQKKALTVSVKTDADLDKTYDTTANLKNAATSYLDLNTAGQMVGTDTAMLTGASGSYDSANAGNRTVTFNDFAIDNSNYYVSTTSLQGSGTIAQKVIDAGKVKADGGALSKVYDGSTDATAAIVGKTLTSEGFITGDDVSLTATGAEYNAATVAGATTVTYSGVSLGGASAANYKIDSTTLTGDGTITPKTVHAAATGSVTGKTYDGQELSLADLNIQLNQDDIVTKTGASTKDDVTLTGTISATKGGSPVAKIKDAGEYALSYDGFGLGGTDNGNYTLSMDTSTLPQNVTIAKRMLTADIANGAYREYEAGNNNTNNVNVKLSGFVADSDYSVTADDKVTTIVGTYGKWDATNGFTGDNNVSRSTTTTNYVPVEGKNYGYKAINYDGFANAVVDALGTASAAAAENYYVGNVTGNNGSAAATMTKDTTGLVQTAYFKEADKMGYLTPIAITAASIKEKWSNVEKVYDGTTSVNNPLDKFTLYYDANGNNQQDTNEGSIAYKIAEGGSTVYNSADVATANTVTYRGVKVDENTALTDNPNYEMAADIFAKYNGAIDDTHAISVTDGTTKVAINKRGLYVNPTANTPEKIYDGTTTVNNPSDYIALVTTKTGDTGVITGDDVSLNTSGITGTYADMDAGKNKDVTYSGLALKGTKAGNYEIINAEGMATTTATGKGKINPREIMVDIKNRDVSKTYDSTTNALTDGVGGTIKPFQYATDAEDTGNKNLVKATVTGGSITYDTVNNDIIYTPTAGTGVVKVHLDSANYTDKNASEAHALGVDYVLSYDSNNIVLVHNTSTDSMTTPAIVNSRMSATLRGENIGTITPRAIQIKDLYATKEYDGTDVVKGLNGDNMIVHDVATNTDFAKGKLVGNDTVNDLGLKVNGGKYSGTDAAASEDATELIEHTISDVGVNITNGNYTIDNSTPTTGKGVITRKTITANPTNVKTAPGETPTFSGSFSGFVGDDGAQAAQDFEWKSDSYPDKISEKGSYEVYAWYTNGNRRDGNYGKNYTFGTPANTAWTVGYTDPLDPSNPDSPFNPDNPLNPSQSDSPLNPNSGVGQAIAQASKFKPDDKSYNRASHDDNIEHFGQQSAISIQYEDAGVNVGDEEAVVGKRSLIGIESAGNVVNLGDAEMRAGNIGIESNGVNLGSTAEQAAIEAGLPATESYEAVPAVTTAEQEDAVVESPFLSRLRQGQSAASDESEGEVSKGISIITAEPEDEDEEEKKNRAALMARSDRETHIGIETIGGGVNMAAAVR